MKRKYIPHSDEATRRRHYAQQRNWKLLQIAGARQTLCRIAELHSLPTKSIKGLTTWLSNTVKNDYDTND